MHVRKEKIITNEVDLVKENQDLRKRVMAEIRRMQVRLQRTEGYIVGNGN